MLSRTEKGQRVNELYQQGKTIREIAQEVHMSFGDIGSISVCNGKSGYPLNW
jgi:hypothetical protein